MALQGGAGLVLIPCFREAEESGRAGGWSEWLGSACSWKEFHKPFLLITPLHSFLECWWPNYRAPLGGSGRPPLLSSDALSQAPVSAESRVLPNISSRAAPGAVGSELGDDDVSARLGLKWCRAGECAKGLSGCLCLPQL